MIVVVAKLTTDAERRDELIRLGEAVAAASRAEEGCLGYRLFQATDDPHAFVMVEEWADRAALEAHFATEHVATFMRAFPATLSEAPDVRFHDVSGSRTLQDVQR